MPLYGPQPSYDLVERGTAPSTPAAGVKIYASTDNELHQVDDSGNDIPIATMVGGGRRLFVQSTDPAASAVDGDVWIQIP